MPAHVPKYYTVEEVLALPNDGQRYELVYGELLVSPAPHLLHQRIVGRVFRVVASYCEREGVGEAFISPADLTWGRKDVLAQPDVFVIGSEDALVRTWEDVRRIPLIVEVLSPSTERCDRFEKRVLYRDRAVDVYWILDPNERLAEVWMPTSQFPIVERERVIWYPDGASAPLTTDLPLLLAG
jgi:Uma2 family endonuclease